MPHQNCGPDLSVRSLHSRGNAPRSEKSRVGGLLGDTKREWCPTGLMSCYEELSPSVCLAVESCRQEKGVALILWIADHDFRASNGPSTVSWPGDASAGAWERRLRWSAVAADIAARLAAGGVRRVAYDVITSGHAERPAVKWRLGSTWGSSATLLPTTSAWGGLYSDFPAWGSIAMECLIVQPRRYWHVGRSPRCGGVLAVSDPSLKRNGVMPGRLRRAGVAPASVGASSP